MERFDVLSGVPLTHDIQLKLWWCDMRTISSEDSEVFPIEWSGTEYQSYLVQLRPNEEYPGMLPAYLWVSELDTRGVIPEDEVNETDLGEHPVFDKLGRYLGTFETVKGNSIKNDDDTEETPRVASMNPDKDLHNIRESGAPNFHCIRFSLRRGAEDVCLRVPEDLTAEEQARLLHLVQALPTKD